MSIQNIVLLLAGLINLVMSIFIISRGWRNKVNLYFSLLTFFNFLWAFSLFLGSVLINSWWFFWSKSAFLSAIGIIVSLFYFLNCFPFKLKEISKKISIFILTIAILLSVVFYIDNLFVIGYEKDMLIAGYKLYIYKPLFLFFAFYFFGLVIASVYLLVKKYNITDATFKRQIKLLLITIIIGLIFGSYFNLILLYFNIWKFFWLGPIFTVFMNMAVFYLIFSSKGKQHG